MTTTDELLVRTFLPLLPWLLQKTGGAPTIAIAHATAQSLIPPPNNVRQQIIDLFGAFSHPAMRSASYRRKVRRRVMHHIDRHKRLRQVKQSVERIMAEIFGKSWWEKVSPADLSRIRKDVETEKEIKEHYAQLEETDDLLQAYPFISPSQKHEVVALLFEFALTGQSHVKPRVKFSSLAAAFGFDSDYLQSLSAEAFVQVTFSRLMQIYGIGRDAPDEVALTRILRLMVKTHLPPEQEHQTTPEALKKATEAGLIHRGLVVKDKETGEVVHEYVEDPRATCLIREVEDEDEARGKFDRIVSHVKLSPAERLVLQGMRQQLKGEELAEWAAAQEGGPRKASVPVLASKVMDKLRRAAKT